MRVPGVGCEEASAILGASDIAVDIPGHCGSSSEGIDVDNTVVVGIVNIRPVITSRINDGGGIPHIRSLKPPEA